VQVVGFAGAPRPMKMGTTPSRFPYDVAARDALQLASLRCSAIQHDASWIPDIAGGPVDDPRSKVLPRPKRLQGPSSQGSRSSRDAQAPHGFVLIAMLACANNVA
jgi:hypothetical protein